MNNSGTASNYRNRQPKGRPTGGQFANTERPESAIVLDGSQLTPAAQFISAIVMSDIATDAAGYWNEHYHGAKRKSAVIDVDDVAQETLVQVLTAVKKGRQITDPRQMLNSVAANLTVRATERFRPENRRAMRALKKKEDAFVAEHGRNPRPTERDALIDEVNAEWPDPRHKPAKGWHVPDYGNISLDRPLTEDGGVESTLGAGLVAADYDEAIPGSALEKFLELSEEKGFAAKAEAKRLAWNGLAELNDAPLAVAGSLSQRQVTKHRTAMKEHGIAKACEDWHNDVDSEARDALFAPFGEVDFLEEERIVELFEKYRRADNAQAMWESAISYANTKHAA